jgi:hypothetical protein
MKIHLTNISLTGTPYLLMGTDCSRGTGKFVAVAGAVAG